MNPVMKSKKKWNIFAEAATPFNMDKPNGDQWGLLGVIGRTTYVGASGFRSIALTVLNGSAYSMSFMFPAVNQTVMAGFIPDDNLRLRDIYRVPAEIDQASLSLFDTCMQDAVNSQDYTCDFFTNDESE